MAGRRRDSFVLTVTAVNDAPTISDTTDKTTNEDTATAALSVTVGDVETPAGTLTVAGSSSNTALVPAANIVVGGTGASRTVTITPAPNQSGTATITLTVTDGDGGTATDSFVLTVTAVNDAPTISDVDRPDDERGHRDGGAQRHGRRRRNPSRHPDGRRELLEHGAGADRQHRRRRDGREPDGDDHAGAESVRHRDDHPHGDRRGWRRRRRTASC